MKTTALVISLFLFLTSCTEMSGVSSVWLEAYEKSQTLEEKGAATFLYYDFGALNEYNLETNVLPWKLMVTALLFKSRDLIDKTENIIQQRELLLQESLEEIGFFYPDIIANTPELLKVPKKFPLGIFRGEMSGKKMFTDLKLEASGLSCISCHSQRGFDVNGVPNNELWLGVGSSSFNPEKYVSTIFQGLKNIVSGKKQEFFSLLVGLFPEMDSTEKETYEVLLGMKGFSLFNKIEKGIEDIVKTTNKATPIPNGSPGLTNGVGSLKNQLGLIDKSRYHENEVGFTSIPSIFDRGLRSSLLYDGLYSPLGGVDGTRDLAEVNDEWLKELSRIIVYFTVPINGNKPEEVGRSAPYAFEVLKYLEEAPRPPFPGKLDFTKVKLGRQIYIQNCSSCHGSYVDDRVLVPQLMSFPNRFVLLNEIGTDSRRAKLIDSVLESTLSRGVFGQDMLIVAGKGYVAPVLSNLWMTAPYLHNGSVPSLWALMNPELRPEVFLVGGHRLNYETMGISHVKVADGNFVYDYTPWSKPNLYDTKLTGQANQGHEKEFAELSLEDKRYLLEYLKTL